METNYIIIRLLEELLRSDGSLPLERPMQRLGITRRTLLYNLNKLNVALHGKGLPQISLIDEHLQLDLSRAGEIRTALLDSDQTDPAYVLSQEERKTLILLAIGLLRDDVSLSDLTEHLQVSKNTAMTSLNGLRNDLKELGVSVVVIQRSGYSLRAGEFVIRCLLYEHLIQPMTRQLRLRVDPLLVRSICGESARPEERDRLFFTVSSCIRSASLQVGLDLSYNSVQDLSYAVLMILCRTGRGELHMEDRELMESAEYRASGLIAESLTAAGITFPPEEKSFLTAVLMSAKKFDSFYLQQEQPTILDEFIDELIDSFELCACLVLDNKAELKRKLMLHIRPMYYRIRYHIKNHFKSDLQYAYNIQKEYPDIYRYTQSAVRVSESILGVSIPEEEVAFLCVYFVSWLVNHSTQTVPGSGNILIICGAGVGTSLFVHHQITELLGHDYEIDIRDLGDFTPESVEAYDLVLSTVPLPAESPNIILVNPILSGRDKETLLNWQYSARQSGSSPYLEELFSIISESAIITDRPKLMSSLRKYLSTNFAYAQRASLHDVLTPRGVRLYEGKRNRREAIMLSAQPLVDSGAVPPDYAEAILSAMEERGVYPLLAPGILLAHSKPDSAVRRVGLSVSVFREGLTFSGEVPVHTIFALCTPDNAAHVSVIRDLSRLLSDRELLRRLQVAEFSDEEEIWLALIQET